MPTRSASRSTPRADAAPGTPRAVFRCLQENARPRRTQPQMPGLALAPPPNLTRTAGRGRQKMSPRNQQGAAYSRKAKQLACLTEVLAPECLVLGAWSGD